jgi:alkaline phosphatase D
MKLNRRQWAQTAVAAAGAQAQNAVITHGPFLGAVAERSVWVWARTPRPGSFRIRYGTRRDAMTELTDPVPTHAENDCAAWRRLEGLTPGTRYFYTVEGSGIVGTFATVPDSQAFLDRDTNPRGLFNFSFQFGSCADQKVGGERGKTLPAYRTMREQHGRKCLFSIMNGDWVYEEKRDFTVEQWKQQTGETQLPRMLELAPSMAGVWENFKLYLERGVNLAAWHREMPGYFTPDDHEILNDVYGTGTPGTRTQEAVFRDIALTGWYHYIAGSNPLATRQGIHFGMARLEGDLLIDEAADFRKIDLNQATNLHVHWGGQLAGTPPGKNPPPGNPNAGVYGIDAILDSHRIRVKPGFPARGAGAYSIGRHHYGKFRVGNVEIYLLDTRGMRDMHDTRDARRAGPLLLGSAQHRWLKESMAASDADFFFLASSVNLMVPHVGAPTSNDPIAGKDDAWTAFLAEREELIDFWNKLDKPVLVMTGDLHNSWAIRVTGKVWEFAAGPHNSQNHPLLSEGSRPTNGPFDSRGRPCDIRWSSFVRNDVPARLRWRPIYAVAQINNVFLNPAPDGRDRWVAYEKPHVVIQYYDGVTGDLLYAEPVHR